MHAVLNPLVLLLTTLVIVSFATGDFRAGTVMSAMIVLGVDLNLIQEGRASKAAAKLKAMISLTATVIRDGQSKEVAISQVVPGDVVSLAAGFPKSNQSSRSNGPQSRASQVHSFNPWPRGQESRTLGLSATG